MSPPGSAPEAEQRPRRTLGSVTGSATSQFDTATAVRELGGNPQATVLTTAHKTSAPHAALLNAIASLVLDDEDQPGSPAHPGWSGPRRVEDAGHAMGALQARTSRPGLAWRAPRGSGAERRGHAGTGHSAPTECR